MKLSLPLLLLFSILIPCACFSQIAEGPIQMRSYLSDIGENLNPKMAKKDWRKNSEAWQKKVGKATDYETLAFLAEELDGFLLDEKVTEGWKLSREDWALELKKLKKATSFAELMQEFAESNESLLEENWISRLETWTTKMNDLAEETEAKDAKMLMESERIVIDVSEAQPVVEKAWADAKGGFKNLKDGEMHTVGLSDFFQCNLPFPKAKGTVIEKVNEDDSFVLKYTAVFECGTYKENALALKQNLVEILKKSLPDEFSGKGHNRQGYIDSKLMIFELGSGDFAKVAKNPTASVGVRLTGAIYVVEMRIEEPVFK